MKKTRLVLSALGVVFVLAALFAGGLYLYIVPQLPSIEVLRDVRFQVPLRVYSSEGLLLAEYGEKRRAPVSYEEVPEQLIQAFLAAEDDRFFEHPGVDYQGLLRAAYQLALTGEKRQGGSTITMQVARNFFLSREKTYLRKLTEIFLALKIERQLSKEQILELYLNKIYLGQRAYGVGAAAQIYYGVPIEELNLPQIAMIAGLPKAPSRDNPVSNPQRAENRRNYVLGRMYTLGFIDAETYRQALETEVRAELHAASSELRAGYVAEMARAEMVERYGDAAYTDGYRVYTTIQADRQRAARRALRRALIDYDTRHGYRGPDGHVELSERPSPMELKQALENSESIGGLRPALVTEVHEKRFQALLPDGRLVEIDWEGIEWARPYLSPNRRGSAPESAGDVVSRGDLVRVLQREEGGWRLTQLPELEGALVSMEPDTGLVVALVGGFDYFQSKFNRAVQARRQPGSSFKPFIYSAALNKGFTPASVLNDAPVVFDDPSLEASWRPENYSGRFYGPTRLREAITHSRNLVSIRLLRAIGVPYALEYVQRFGFDPAQLPANLSLSLGSGSVAPIEMARGFAVFANGGYRVEPYFIARIADADDQVVFEASPRVVCRDCEAPQPELETQPAASPEDAAAPSADDAERGAGQQAAQPGRREAASDPPPAERVLTEHNAWLMNDLLQDVIQHGTGRRARQLGRRDLGGKTGTTNDQRDAWFCGYAPSLVTISWVGFDEVAPLGRGETGSRAALPMWIAYMREALEGVPEIHREQPEGMVTVRIDPENGLLAASDQEDAIFETFRKENVPTRYSSAGPDRVDVTGSDTTPGKTDPLF